MRKPYWKRRQGWYVKSAVLRSQIFLPLTSSTVRDRARIELPFGHGKTNPVAAADVARVVAEVLANPETHLGRVYELTGPRSQDMDGSLGSIRMR